MGAISRGLCSCAPPLQLEETGDHHFVQYEAAPRGDDIKPDAGDDPAGFVDYFL